MRDLVPGRGIEITPIGSTATTLPAASTSKPDGWFIQLFAATTENVPPIPAKATGIPDRRWSPGESRRQP